MKRRGTSTSIAPIYNQGSLEEGSVVLELSQSFGGARGAFDDASNLVLTEVFEDVGELIACWNSFLDVCNATWVSGCFKLGPEVITHRVRSRSFRPWAAEGGKKLGRWWQWSLQRRQSA